MRMPAKGAGLLMVFGLEPWAAKWLETAGNADMRVQKLEGLARTWLEKEPAAAQAWLERASLPEQVKARLLNPGNNQ